MYIFPPSFLSQLHLKKTVCNIFSVCRSNKIQLKAEAPSRVFDDAELRLDKLGPLGDKKLHGESRDKAITGVTKAGEN